MKILNRASAKQAQLKRYFTGQPCKRGHISERIVSTGCCLSCNQERMRERYSANPTAHNQAMKARYDQETEKHRAWAAERYRRNRTQRIDQVTEWQKANPDKVNAKQAKRRASKLHATLAGHDEALQKIYHECPAGHEVDHQVPLQSPVVCGLHVPWNLQYLTPAENRSKSNKLLSTFR